MCTMPLFLRFWVIIHQFWYSLFTGFAFLGRLSGRKHYFSYVCSQLADDSIYTTALVVLIALLQWEVFHWVFMTCVLVYHNSSQQTGKLLLFGMSNVFFTIFVQHLYYSLSNHSLRFWGSLNLSATGRGLSICHSLILSFIHCSFIHLFICLLFVHSYVHLVAAKSELYVTILSFLLSILVSILQSSNPSFFHSLH